MVYIAKKKNQSISLKTTALLILIILFIGVGATLWYYALYKVVHTDYIEMSINVDPFYKKVGFSADPTLHFGKVGAGGIVKKEMTVWNNREFPVRIEITAKGDIGTWVHVKNSSFVLMPEESKILQVTMMVPKNLKVSEDVDYVTFYGKMRIRHYRE